IGEKTAVELRRELSELGASALVEVLASPELLTHPWPQVGEATYAEKLTKETFHLEPSMTVALASRIVRLGGAHMFVDGKRIAVMGWSRSDGNVEPGVVTVDDRGVVVGFADGVLVLDDVRPEGSSTMDARSWWRGLRRERLSWS
ncbi:MAG TPA: hypothetical protein VGP11_05935, partial [Acidimicrobiales bacterium]|nr:hypothetical protein [Acidimicrobiales bacterium]